MNPLAQEFGLFQKRYFEDKAALDKRLVALEMSRGEVAKLEAGQKILYGTIQALEKRIARLETPPVEQPKEYKNILSRIFSA